MLSYQSLMESGGPNEIKLRYPNVRGRVGPKRARLVAKVTSDGRIRVDCAANPEFWLEIDIPENFTVRIEPSQNGSPS